MQKVQFAVIFFGKRMPPNRKGNGYLEEIRKMKKQRDEEAADCGESANTFHRPSEKVFSPSKLPLQLRCWEKSWSKPPPTTSWGSTFGFWRTCQSCSTMWSQTSSRRWRPSWALPTWNWVVKSISKDPTIQSWMHYHAKWERAFVISLPPLPPPASSAERCWLPTTSRLKCPSTLSMVLGLLRSTPGSAEVVVELPSFVLVVPGFFEILQFFIGS